MSEKNPSEIEINMNNIQLIYWFVDFQSTCFPQHVEVCLSSNSTHLSIIPTQYRINIWLQQKFPTSTNSQWQPRDPDQYKQPITMHARNSPRGIKPHSRCINKIREVLRYVHVRMQCASIKDAAMATGNASSPHIWVMWRFWQKQTFERLLKITAQHLTSNTY